MIPWDAHPDSMMPYQVAKSEPSQDEGSKKGDHAPCGIDHVRLGEIRALLRRSVSFFLASFKCRKKTASVFSITSWWFQTQLKNMIVKLDHVPKDQGENKQNV